MMKHRKHERIHPQQNIEIFDFHTDEAYGALADISAGGLMLVGSVELPVNRIYQLRLKLSEAVLGHQEIDLGVDTLWSRPNATEDRFWTGCCLICVSPEAEAVLRELVQEPPETGREQDPGEHPRS